MSDFKCIKCGMDFPNNEVMQLHSEECKGASISMDIINTIAEGGSKVSGKIGFTCDICGESQMRNDLTRIKARVKWLEDNCRCR